MTDSNLKELLNFLPKTDQQDEDNYQLTMITWYLISKHRAPIDISLSLKYCLVSEFLLHHQNNDEKIAALFPEFKDLHHLINDYKKQTYKEGQFVFALSKLLPILNELKNDNKVTSVQILEDNQKIFEKADIVREYVRYISAKE